MKVTTEMLGTIIASKSTLNSIAGLLFELVRVEPEYHRGAEYELLGRAYLEDARHIHDVLDETGYYNNIK